jgi:hypothetical protein
MSVLIVVEASETTAQDACFEKKGGHAGAGRRAF